MRHRSTPRYLAGSTRSARRCCLPGRSSMRARTSPPSTISSGQRAERLSASSRERTARRAGMRDARVTSPARGEIRSAIRLKSSTVLGAGEVLRRGRAASKNRTRTPPGSKRRSPVTAASLCSGCYASNSHHSTAVGLGRIPVSLGVLPLLSVRSFRTAGSLSVRRRAFLYARGGKTPPGDANQG